MFAFNSQDNVMQCEKEKKRKLDFSPTQVWVEENFFFFLNPNTMETQEGEGLPMLLSPAARSCRSHMPKPSP